MPFIRQSRDKRGFEYTYVMHTYHPGGGGASKPRLLYLFRSPSNAKFGRTALDAEVMEALEHTHPDLSFDWQGLTRDASVTRAENGNDRDRPSQQNHQQQRRPMGRQAVQQRPLPPESTPPPALPPDDSVLGRALGAAEASRMRRRYAELMQRVARRARTPEDRDRLTERLKRLNPEDWTDEAQVRANAPGADAGWNAISGELPSRRRGRRGGRGRPEGDQRPSVIMASESQSAEAVDEEPEDSGVSGPDDSGSDRGAVGAGPDPNPGPADSDSEASADPDVPVGD